MEIDEVRVDNKLEGPQPFSELIGPYLANQSFTDFNRRKMIRIYWRDLSPVAGIPVVEHFGKLEIFIKFNIEY